MRRRRRRRRTIFVFAYSRFAQNFHWQKQMMKMMQQISSFDLNKMRQTSKLMTIQTKMLIMLIGQKMKARDEIEATRVPFDGTPIA
jgi:hypothetical protein